MKPARLVLRVLRSIWESLIAVPSIKCVERLVRKLSHKFGSLYILFFFLFISGFLAWMLVRTCTLPKWLFGNRSGSEIVTHSNRYGISICGMVYNGCFHFWRISKWFEIFGVFSGLLLRNIIRKAKKQKKRRKISVPPQELWWCVCVCTSYCYCDR